MPEGVLKLCTTFVRTKNNYTTLISKNKLTKKIIVKTCFVQRLEGGKAKPSENLSTFDKG